MNIYTIVETTDGVVNKGEVDVFKESDFKIEEHDTFEDALETVTEKLLDENDTGAVYHTITTETLGELLEKQVKQDILPFYFDTTIVSPQVFIESIGECIDGLYERYQDEVKRVEELEWEAENSITPECKTLEQEMELEELLENFKHKHYL